MNDSAASPSTYYALAEVRFPHVVAMADYIPRIQDRLRQEGFPLYQDPLGPDRPSWRMRQIDQKGGLYLQPWSLVYHTTHFDSHHELFSTLLRCMKVVHEITQLACATHLYFRCLDAILPRDGETVEDFLADGWHGFRAEGFRSSHSESILDTSTAPLVPQGTLVLRIFRATSPLGFPSDLASHDLTMKPAFSRTESLPHAVIDTDHFVQGVMPLDYTALYEQLLSLYRGSRNLFSKITTEHARKVWS